VSTIASVLRRQFLAPPLDDVMFATRGFHTHDHAARDLLELSARQFLIGFEFVMESQDTAEAVARLETLEREFRGFAYEGAGMAVGILDALHPGLRPGTRAEEFLRDGGKGATHIYMAYIGIGIAVSRLPRPLRARAIPDITKMPDEPALSWYIWDGYGFERAFYNPKKWIVQKRTEKGPFAWKPTSYVKRAIDQGIGRVLWFYEGASVTDVAALVGTFPAERRADLWSGVGTAASYAGGVDASGLEQLKQLSGRYQAELALGAVLAMKARVLADTVSDHSELAAKVLCGSDPVTAAFLTNTAAIDLPPDGEVPAYEEFRRRIRENFE
jgi:hypothetical protein